MHLRHHCRSGCIGCRRPRGAPADPWLLRTYLRSLQTGLVQVTTIDANAAAKAKHTVETMLAQGSDSSACGGLADSILTEVTDNIKSKEEVRVPLPPKPFDAS